MNESRLSFLGAAARLDRIVKAIKDGQLAATGTPPRPADDSAALHPEEAWARRFAVHRVRGARDIGVGAPPLSAFAPPVAGAPRTAPAKEPRAPVPAKEGGHIGLALGKPALRRSWLARLFRGR